MFKFFLKNSKKKFKHSLLASDLLECRYQELVVKHHIQSDDAQIEALGHLQQLLDDILVQSEPKKIVLFSRRLSSAQKKAKSIYIFGDVGRGKSMLMDVFFQACPIKLKRRIHFHAFMQEVHQYMHDWRSNHQGDPLPSLAIKIQKSALLLCFDEFQVTDIADAMLLSRLFTQLIDLGVIFVATSNQHPDDLYKGGLQRELFLPFIALLKQSSEILELVAKEDYRLSHFKAMKTVFYSEEKGADEFLQQSFNELTNCGNTEIKRLKVQGRELEFAAVHGDILFSSFEELCNRPLGSADYLIVASEYSTIFIAEIPIFSVEIRDQVRRFVTLIDTLYESNVKLICTLAVPVEELQFEDSHFDFKRTKSRLIEMQSEQYLQRQHLLD
ncbi:MAG: AFG1 family ATPase [Methylococcales bacterium]|nr:AFG1 family ATPase [Methylococcales bacterium]